MHSGQVCIGGSELRTLGSNSGISIPPARSKYSATAQVFRSTPDENPLHARWCAGHDKHRVSMEASVR